MTATATAVETTGQMTAVWRPFAGPDVVVEVEPVDPDRRRNALHVTVLEDLPREPGNEQVVVLPSGRYLIGRPHPTRPFEHYLHRL